jgi:hypothetical protein
MDRA